jgi:hypothetical protein
MIVYERTPCNAGELGVLAWKQVVVGRGGNPLISLYKFVRPLLNSTLLIEPSLSVAVAVAVKAIGQEGLATVWLCTMSDSGKARPIAMNTE